MGSGPLKLGAEYNSLTSVVSDWPNVVGHLASTGVLCKCPAGLSSVGVGAIELDTVLKDNVIVVTSVSRVEYGARVACAYDAVKSCDVAVAGNVRCEHVNVRLREL